MRNKYKSLQSKGKPQNEKSYVISEKINSLSNNFKSNNVNKNSFISNFDNKEKLDKMINQINDKEKKPFNEKRHAASFISNDKNNQTRSSNHNIFYSVYKRENKDNSNKQEIKETNNKNKIDYFSSKYYNLNRNVKINLDNKDKNKKNAEKQNIKTENVRDSYSNRRQINKNYNSLNNNHNNNDKVINKYNVSNNNNDKSIKINNFDNNNHNYNYTSRNLKKNNLSVNLNHNNINNNKKEKEKEKEDEYKTIKWNIKEQKLKVLNNKTIVSNSYSTSNINYLSNKNKVENPSKEKTSNNKRTNYNKMKEEIKENKTIIKNEEKRIHSNYQSKKDIFQNTLNNKITYRSKRALLEDEKEDQIKNVKNKNEETGNKTVINHNNVKNEQNINKFDNENKNHNNNNNESLLKKIKNEKLIKEYTKSPNVFNDKNPETEPRTEEGLFQKNKFKRYFYFRANRNKENKDNIENKDKDKNENKENKEIRVNKEAKFNKDINENKYLRKNKEDNIEKVINQRDDDDNKQENNINIDNSINSKEIKQKNVSTLSPSICLSPIPTAHVKTESNISPKLEEKVKEKEKEKSSQSKTVFKRLNTYMYTMNKKQSFKDLIHEVNLNKDFQESFSNIFESCKKEINNDNNPQDLNKSFSCFSNSNNELKLKLNLDESMNISQYLKVNLKGKKSSDINNYNNNPMTKGTNIYSPSSNLIYKKKMNLIKTISTKYKKSLPNFIYNSINNLNSKRNSELTYGNIINNNTYNTTLNIYTGKQLENQPKFIDINNMNEISEIKHLRGGSELKEDKEPFYSQLFYPNKEKEKNNLNTSRTHKKNKSISITSELPEAINGNNTSRSINYKINLEILYIVESKLQNILSKVNNYIICPNECFDLITYYFSSKFYEREINVFKTEQNKKNITHYIKLELLCYFLCYDVCFNKSFSQTGILLKTIFNLLHNNYLILVSFIINEAEKSFDNNLINNEYSMKLKHIIKNNMKIKLSSQNLDENLVVNLIGNNLKQVSNYYKMIIDNLYSHFYLKKSSKKNYADAKYKFPQCLQLDIDNLDYYEKLNVISLFFFDAYNRLLNNHNFEDMKYFFDSFLQRIKFNQIKDNKKPKSKSKSKQNKLLSSSSTTKDIKNVVVYKYNYNGGFYYLPPMKKYYKYTLVLDLDETLIYLMPNNIYLTEEGKIGETRHSLIFRPGLIEFLKKMKNIYELIIFSFGTLEYVDSVIKIIEKNEKFFEHVLYRQHATINNGEYIKDLSLLGRNLKNILIVDDISQVFKLQEKNGICIKAFYGDIVGDRNTLKILGKILEKVRFDADEDGDIRKSLEKQKNVILSHITNNVD